MKKLLLLVACLGLAIGLPACSGKKEKPAHQKRECHKPRGEKPCKQKKEKIPCEQRKASRGCGSRAKKTSAEEPRMHKSMNDSKQY